MVEGVVAPSTRVLVVARRPRANPTHPNVVSVPTQRLPPQLYEAIVASATVVGQDVTGHVAYFRDDDVDSAAHNGHAAVLYATEALLARKLGLAEALESERLRYTAGLRARVDGAAVYDNLATADVYEPVAMLNVLVECSDAADAMPLCTDSYSLIAWTSVEQFIQGVRSRDAAALNPAFDPIELCVHGVCLQAAQATLSHVVGRPAIAAAKRPRPSADLALRPMSLTQPARAGRQA